MGGTCAAELIETVEDSGGTNADTLDSVGTDSAVLDGGGGPSIVTTSVTTCFMLTISVSSLTWPWASACRGPAPPIAMAQAMCRDAAFIFHEVYIGAQKKRYVRWSAALDVNNRI